MTKLETSILAGSTAKNLIAQGYRATAVKYARKRLVKAGKLAPVIAATPTPTLVG